MSENLIPEPETQIRDLRRTLTQALQARDSNAEMLRELRDIVRLCLIAAGWMLRNGALDTYASAQLQVIEGLLRDAISEADPSDIPF